MVLEAEAFTKLSSDLYHARTQSTQPIISVRMAEAMNTADFLQLANIGELPVKRARCANNVGSPPVPWQTHCCDALLRK